MRPPGPAAAPGTRSRAGRPRRARRRRSRHRRCRRRTPRVRGGRRCRCARRAPRRGPRRPARAVLRTPPAPRPARSMRGATRPSRCVRRRQGTQTSSGSTRVLLALEVVRLCAARSPRARAGPRSDRGPRGRRRCGRPAARDRGRGRSASRPRTRRAAPRGRRGAGRTREAPAACGMSALQLAPVPASRAAWRSRAARTSSRTAAEEARGGAVSISSSGRSTPTCRSMRSSSGPLSLLRWRLWSAVGALARLAPAPARARVRGGDEHEAGRQQRRALAAHDRHLPVLERLAQRLQRRPRELRQLVEEQDAVMGEARLARAGVRRRRRRGRTRRSCGAERGTAARR